MSQISLDSFPPEGGKRRLIADQVRDYVDRHFHRGISLRDVAREIGYSPAHLTYLYRVETGKPITASIIERRMREACVLLGSEAVTIARVAERVGFRDVAYFSRQFRRFAGMTPGRWRQRDSADLSLPDPDDGGRRCRRDASAEFCVVHGVSHRHSTAE